MRQLGSLLLFFGLGSIALHFIGYEFSVLIWIDNWGPEVGWAIRVGLVLAGCALYFIGMRGERAVEAPSPAQPAAPMQQPDMGAAPEQPAVGSEPAGTREQ